MSVEILAVGNELLDGVTQDSNTHWLCREITGIGGWVRHAAMVRDDPEAIVAEVRASRQRGTALLLITGGLGPTADDLTLAAVASAVEVPLVEHPLAREMVARKYEALHQRGAVAFPELTPERLKMALLPEGAAPVENPVGAAPGVLLTLGGMTLVCLPGVPAELKGIFSGSLRPTLLSVLGAGILVEREVLVRLGDESAMASALQQVAAHYPSVYVKSHARCFDGIEGIRVTLSARGSDRAALERTVEAAAAEIRRRLPTA